MDTVNLGSPEKSALLPSGVSEAQPSSSSSNKYSRLPNDDAESPSRSSRGMEGLLRQQQQLVRDQVSIREAFSVITHYTPPPPIQGRPIDCNVRLCRQPPRRLPRHRVRAGRAGGDVGRVRDRDRERRDEAGRHHEEDGQRAAHVKRQEAVDGHRGALERGASRLNAHIRPMIMMARPDEEDKKAASRAHRYSELKPKETFQRRRGLLELSHLSC